MKTQSKLLIILILAVGLSLPACELLEDLFEDDNNEVINDNDDHTVTDIDGNEYQTVIIGDQEWFAENLKTMTYKDGTDIQNVTDGDDWPEHETGAYAWYDNDVSNKDTYGALYNWYAVATDKLCPDGWRVPTYEDWTELTDYLGGEDVAGGKLKATGTIEAGTGLWHDPNTGATNETGFTALPGGARHFEGHFIAIGLTGIWWSSTDHSVPATAWRFDISHNSAVLNEEFAYKTYGFAVRCIKE